MKPLTHGTSSMVTKSTSESSEMYICMDAAEALLASDPLGFSISPVLLVRLAANRFLKFASATRRCAPGRVAPGGGESGSGERAGRISRSSTERAFRSLIGLLCAFQCYYWLLALTAQFGLGLGCAFHRKGSYNRVVRIWDRIYSCVADPHFFLNRPREAGKREDMASRPSGSLCRHSPSTWSGGAQSRHRASS